VAESTRAAPRAPTRGARGFAGVSRRLGAWTASCVVVDALMLAAAVVVADLGSGRAGVPPTPALWLAAFPLLTFLFMALRGMYRPRVFLRVLDDLRVAITATALAAMIVLSLRVLTADDPWVAAQTARLWAFASVYLLAGRVVLSWSELQARRRGESVRPTLVVGAGRVGRLTARRLQEHPELGLRPVGFLDKEPLEGKEGDLPVLGASWDLDRIVAEHGVRHVVLSFSTAPQSVLLRVMRRCQELGVEVSMVPRFYEKVMGHIGVEYLGGLPLMTAQPTNPRGWHFAVKYLSDRLVASLLLMLVSPVLLLSALGVLLTSGRPVFFRQPRAGLDGRVFPILKLRTMRPPRPGEVQAVHELPAGTAPGGVEGEDRRTALGAFLRKTSIDELPQLWNVVRGEMSLVGPRPERPEYVERFSEQIERYGERHRVKAGITGWAQVHGLRGQTSLADRVEWDNYYIENWSLWLDVKILLLTVIAIVRPAQAE
jgi:exopolysaccharide biosynthesis polyprenyl glycosylphosphotransferase